MPRVRRSEKEQQLVDEYGPDYLEVLARGLRILGTFNAIRNPVSAAELSIAVDLPRATVRRVLYTLEKLGFVETDGKWFRLAPTVLMLASAYLKSNSIPAILQPVVSRISEKTGESCSAAVLDRDEVVFVARASPVRVLSVDLEIGYRLPAYCTSVGRVMLGNLDEAGLNRMLKQIEIKKLTEHTITDVKVLKATIITDNKQGYSIVDQEAEIGLRSIAVPVKQSDGRIACAIHIGAQAERVSVGRMHDVFLPILRQEAESAGSLIL
jgi:IclR family transcriptional regulator, pca regulon regulatory protein